MGVIYWKNNSLFKVAVTPSFFLILFFVFFTKRQQDQVLARNRHARTEGTDPGTCIGACSGRT